MGVGVNYAIVVSKLKSNQEEKTAPDVDGSVTKDKVRPFKSSCNCIFSFFSSPRASSRISPNVYK
jgi:hypothetical protein